jgi:hypothetical protein
VLPDAAPQRRARKTEPSRRSCDVASAEAQRSRDTARLVLRGVTEGPDCRAVEVEGRTQHGHDVLLARTPAHAANAETLEGIQKLAHVSGPGVSRETSPGAGEQPWRFQAKPPSQRQKPRFDQGIEVRHALAKRRDLDLQNGEPEVEVRTEAALPDLLHQIAVRRRDDASREGKRRIASDSLEDAVLQCPEQAGLQWEIELTDLIEEERALPRPFQAPLVARRRAREGPPLVAEELAFDHRGGERSAVRVYEGKLTPHGVSMQDTCHEPLAHARLPGDKHRGGERSDAPQLLAQRVRRRARTHDLRIERTPKPNAALLLDHTAPEVPPPGRSAFPPDAPRSMKAVEGPSQEADESEGLLVWKRRKARVRAGGERAWPSC